MNSQMIELNWFTSSGQPQRTLKGSLPSERLGELKIGYPFHNCLPHWPDKLLGVVSLADYPYNRYPPFINGGSFILSKKAMIMFYYGSMFVKPYIFDDVNLDVTLALNHFTVMSLRPQRGT